MSTATRIRRSLSVECDALLRWPRFLGRRWRRAERVRHFGVLLEREVLGSDSKWERVLLGRYERGEARCLLHALEPGDVVFEIGAGVGFTSALAARIVGEQRVHCYEANPELVPRIRRTHALNGVSPSVVNAVLGRGAGEARFHVRSDFSTSSLSGRPDEPSVPVPQLDLDAELRRTGATCIVLDVEGAESDLVPLIDWSPIHKLILELHPKILGPERTAALLRHLESQGLHTDRRASSSNKRLLVRRPSRSRAPGTLAG